MHQLALTLALTLASSCVFASAQIPTRSGSSPPGFVIADGVLMPAVNLGHPDDEGTETASAELWFKLGGVGIDTAYDYNNQQQVGAALKAAEAMGRNRSSIFITSKISPQRCTAEAAYAAVKEDLNEIGVKRLDLVLHHFPCRGSGATMGNKAVWRGLHQAKTEGLTRAIGVSNYKQADIEAIMALKLGKPAVNQCPMAVGSHDDALIHFCQTQGITFESYSPLRHLNFKDPKLTSIASAHSVSVAQVALRWVTQRGCPVATSPGINQEYSVEDLNLGNFTLSEAEMSILNSI